MELHLLILFLVFTLSNGGLRKMSLLCIQAVIVIVVTIHLGLSSRGDLPSIDSLPPLEIIFEEWSGQRTKEICSPATNECP